MLIASGATGAVTVQKQAAIIATKTFNPASPPKEMPALSDHETAVTDSVFTATVRPEPSDQTSAASSDGFDATLRVKSMRVIIGLKITMWLPKDVSAKLKAHELGHKQIGEKVWASAEKHAKAIGETIVGQEFTGHGKTARDATTDALRQAAVAFEKAYTPAVSGESEAVNSIYDELTEHGSKPDPTEALAIKQAFEKYSANHTDGT